MVLTTHEKKAYWEKKLKHLASLTHQEENGQVSHFGTTVERELRIAQGTIDGCLFAKENGVALMLLEERTMLALILAKVFA
jgi:hypothetical protein